MKREQHEQYRDDGSTAVVGACLAAAAVVVAIWAAVGGIAAICAR